ncbi:hypothetical protein AB4212_43470, partial [Streptomyces sp. 2MCAF27]
MSEPSGEEQGNTQGSERTAQRGFADTFARRTRVPLRGLAPGRRVWSTVVGLPVTAGLAVGAVVLVSTGVSQLHFEDDGATAETVAAQHKAADKAKGTSSAQKPDGGAKDGGEAPSTGDKG